MALLTDKEREKERALFESERARAPHLFERQPMIDTPEFLRWIGIEVDEPRKPVGYLRLFPHDFIVEEIDAQGSIHDVSYTKDQSIQSGEGETYYADLVKIGISTLEAKERLAHQLKIEDKHIGYAGIKDRVALTSQRISIRSLSDAAMLHSVRDNTFFLKNIQQGSGVVANGDLKGNQFIITLRLQESLHDEYVQRVRQLVDDVNQNGFWNFFSFQRFGTPRLLSHYLGRAIVKGEYEEAIKIFVTYQASRELPYFKDIRAHLLDLWGDWRRIEKMLAQFPNHFFIELGLIRHLIKNPTDFKGALHVRPDQTRLWMYAYDCYLFNKKISEGIKRGEVPESLPFLTSFNEHDWEPYGDYLKSDGVVMPSNAFRDFPFVRVKSRRARTLQQVDIHNVYLKDKLAIFSFSLPKGSYATTLLMNFFTLSAGLPVIEHIDTQSVDAKALLGSGSLSSVLDRFSSVLEKRAQDVSKKQKP